MAVDADLEVQVRPGGVAGTAHRPDLFARLDIVERRLEQFGLALGLDVGRARGWCFAQAVLAAIWSVEDGCAAEAEAPLVLARALLDSSALRSDFLD